MKKLSKYDKLMSSDFPLNKDYIIKIYSFRDELKRLIQELMSKQLSNIGIQDDEIGIIYTCVKELVSNAVRENIKHLFCRENQLQLDNDAAYKNSMNILKKKFTDREWVNSYGSRLKSNGLRTELKIVYLGDNITFAVVNNIKVSKIDEERVRDKLELSLKYDSLIDFYNDNFDETGGAGMGLTMITILLKNSSLKNVDFNLMNLKGYLVSLIDIPIPENIKKEPV